MYSKKLCLNPTTVLVRRTDSSSLAPSERSPAAPEGHQTARCGPQGAPGLGAQRQRCEYEDASRTSEMGSWTVAARGSAEGSQFNR